MTLAVANILQRKLRSLISVLAVAIGVTLLLVLVGMTHGSINEVAERIRNVGGDMIVQSEGGTNFLALKSGMMPEKYGEMMEEIEGVRAVSPVVTWTTTFRGQFYVVYGIDPEQFSTIGGELKLVDGTQLAEAGDVVVDSRMAGANGLETGDEIEMLGTTFTISGISKEGIGARIFLLKSQLQEMLHQQGRVSIFFVSCDDPGVVKSVATRIESSVRGVKCQLLENFADEMASSMRGMKQFIGAVTATTLTVSLLVILLAMYTTIMERTKEIGILKSLGASRAYIMGTILLESVMLTVTGVCVGFLLTFAAIRYLGVVFPLLTIEVAPFWIGIGSVLGISGGVLGALYPAHLAVRQDPVKALSYE